jgi:hypothetical protein
MKSVAANARALLACATLLAAASLPVRAEIDPADPPNAVGKALAPNQTFDETNCTHVEACPIGYLVNGEADAGGGYVWQTDYFMAEVDLVYIATNEFDRCRVVDRIRVPMGNPSENAYDGRYLYHYNYGTGLIYKIDPDTHQIVAQCDAPGDDHAEGLAWDGEALWKGDSEHLFRFTPPPDCKLLARIPNPPLDSADGLGFCGGRLIMLGYSGRLYQIDPSDGTIVHECMVFEGVNGNGLDTDGLSQVLADFHGGGRDHFDRVGFDCSGAVPTRSTSWGATKIRYR